MLSALLIHRFKPRYNCLGSLPIWEGRDEGQSRAWPEARPELFPALPASSLRSQPIGNCHLRQVWVVDPASYGIIPHANVLLAIGEATLLMNTVRIWGPFFRNCIISGWVPEYHPDRLWSSSGWTVYQFPPCRGHA